MRLLAMLSCLFFAVAAPAQAASSPQLQPLELQLSSLLAGRSGDVGLAAIDLRSGQTVSVNGDKAYPMASTVKVAVAAAYLAQVDYGRRSIDDLIGGRSAHSLMQAMLIRSDNQATDILIRDLGGPSAVQGWIDFHRLPGVRIDRTIAQLLAAKRDLYDPRDSATPEAMVTLLRELDQGRLLRPASKNYLLSTMRRCITGSNRMKAFLPFGTPVEHKTGTLDGLTTDVGFITLPDGRRLAVAFFARGGVDRPRSIAEAALTIYEGFKRSVFNRFQSMTPTIQTAVPAYGQ